MIFKVASNPSCSMILRGETKKKNKKKIFEHFSSTVDCQAIFIMFIMHRFLHYQTLCLGVNFTYTCTYTHHVIDIMDTVLQI